MKWRVECICTKAPTENCGRHSDAVRRKTINTHCCCPGFNAAVAGTRHARGHTVRQQPRTNRLACHREYARRQTRRHQWTTKQQKSKHGVCWLKQVWWSEVTAHRQLDVMRAKRSGGHNAGNEQADKKEKKTQKKKKEQ
eukprot:NODE_2627_length_1023_cov_47.400670_g2608_i0.p1 GENE.NODE_2627_length_1023_cov_47.400670_g2608_i0~~NODE_2627_length_1023_cov_47.400670_g2608_i0.p1  ORF type:complete len:139 (-),score=10.82 NODE_2627_length_1023_cov_47.400670_g2608_i0:331-747(-)